jgi:8-oxo-dGTP diphosphatase
MTNIFIESPLFCAVVGLAYSLDGSRVALVRKTAKRGEEWQAGRLNGLGGKMEPGERPSDCMRREAWEEAGQAARGLDWQWVASYIRPGDAIAVFRAFTDRLDQFESVEFERNGERVEIHEVATVLGQNLVPNLRYVIPMTNRPGTSLIFPVDLYFP